MRAHALLSLAAALGAAAASAEEKPMTLAHLLRCSVTNLEVRIEVNGVPVAHRRSEAGSAGSSQVDVSQWLKPGENQVRLATSAVPGKPGNKTRYLRLLAVRVEAVPTGEMEGKVLASFSWEEEKSKGPLPAEKTFVFTPAREVALQLWKADVLKDDEATRAGAAEAFLALARSYEAGDAAAVARAGLFQEGEQRRASGGPPPVLAELTGMISGLFQSLAPGAKFKTIGRERLDFRLVAGGRMLLLRGKGAPLLATPPGKDADGNEAGAELDGFGFARLDGKWVWAAQGLE